MKSLFESYKQMSEVNQSTGDSSMPNEAPMAAEGKQAKEKTCKGCGEPVSHCTCTMAEAKEEPPFDMPYTTVKKTITDKSGAKHGPMSRARDLARSALNKHLQKPFEPYSPPKDNLKKQHFGMAEETQVDEAFINGREYASHGLMHPDHAKQDIHQPANREVDFYASKTGDKMSGRVMKNDGKSVHIQANKDLGDGKLHKFKVTPHLPKQVDEVLKPSMGAGAYIDDFVHSKNPKFAGKSKDKRREMALAAFYAAKKGVKEEVETLDESNYDSAEEANRVAAKLKAKYKDGNYHVAQQNGRHKVQHAYFSNTRVKDQIKKLAEEVELSESHAELDKHIAAFAKGIDSDGAQHSTYKNGGGKIPNMKHVSTDASHQAIFKHLQSMGYKKTSGYDPKPNEFDIHHNREEMTSKTDPVHHASGISAHVETEHGNRTKVHFTHRGMKEETELEEGMYSSDVERAFPNGKASGVKTHHPVAPTPDRKYIKGTPENKALRASRKPINGHPTNKMNEDTEMAKIDLQTIINHIERLKPMVDKEMDLPDWIESKITLAADYIGCVADYIEAAEQVGEGLEESSHNVTPTVKTTKYSWGTMKTIHHGSHFSIPLHPEHHEAIAQMKDQQQHTIKTEDGRQYHVKREGDTVHFHGVNGGNKTSVPHKTMTESAEGTMKSFKDFITEIKLADLPVRHVKGRSYGNQPEEPDHDDEDNETAAQKSAEKRGRGRPAGSKSGARQIGGASKKGSGVDYTGYKLHLPNSNKSY